MTPDPTEREPGTESGLAPELGPGQESSADVWEFNTHAFVVRIWREQAATETEPGIWRGHITHVLTGTRRSLQSLAEITDFIRLYLRGMGIES